MKRIRNLHLFSAKALLACTLILCLFIASCAQDEGPARALEQAIEAYTKNPSKDAATAVDVHFDLLDQHIEALENDGQLARAAQLRQEREQLRTQFTAARLAGAINKTKTAIQDMGGALKQVGEEIGSTLGHPTPTPEDE